MQNLNIIVNSNVEVEYEDKVYKSKIQEVEDDYISIYLPVVDGEYLLLKSDEEISMFYYDDKKNTYRLTCRVIGREISGNVRLIKLTNPYDIIQIQRRNFVRVGFVDTVEVGMKSDDEIVYQKEWFTDLSGGGIKFKSKLKHKKNEEVFIKLQQFENNLKLKGRIVRVEKTEDDKYLYGIEFIDISEQEREIIIRNVFKLMRKQRELI